jgi:hypothetical protein
MEVQPGSLNPSFQQKIWCFRICRSSDSSYDLNSQSQWFSIEMAVLIKMSWWVLNSNFGWNLNLRLSSMQFRPGGFQSFAHNAYQYQLNLPYFWFFCDPHFLINVAGSMRCSSWSKNTYSLLQADVTPWRIDHEADDALQKADNRWRTVLVVIFQEELHQ